jgi:hypothetical protein
MSRQDKASYTNIFNALRHDVRRRILLNLSRKQMTFTELYEKIDISSSHMNYHLVSLDGLISKQGTKYVLSESGKTAVSMLGGSRSSPEEKPQVSFIFKYLTVILTLLFVSMITMLLKEHGISYMIIKNGFIEAFVFTVYVNWPVIISLIMKEYYMTPIYGAPNIYSKHYETAQFMM